MLGHHERFTNAAFILTRQSQTVILRFANPSANSGSSKNRRLNGSSTKGDASVPTPLRSRPYATWNPDPRFWVETLIRKETQLPPLSPTSLEYYRNPHL